jgi:hypothetical protein
MCLFFFRRWSLWNPTCVKVAYGRKHWIVFTWESLSWVNVWGVIYTFQGHQIPWKAYVTWRGIYMFRYWPVFFAQTVGELNFNVLFILSLIRICGSHLLCSWVVKLSLSPILFLTLWPFFTNALLNALTSRS